MSTNSIDDKKNYSNALITMLIGWAIFIILYSMWLLKITTANNLPFIFFFGIGMSLCLAAYMWMDSSETIQELNKIYLVFYTLLIATPVIFIRFYEDFQIINNGKPDDVVHAAFGLVLTFVGTFILIFLYGVVYYQYNEYKRWK